MSIPDLTANGAVGLFGQGRQDAANLLKNVGTLFNTQASLQIARQQLLATANLSLASMGALANSQANFGQQINPTTGTPAPQTTTPNNGNIIPV